MTKPNISFQLILEANSIFLSNTPDGERIRANITDLDTAQIEHIVEGIKDAGPEAFNYLKKLIQSESF